MIVIFGKHVDAITFFDILRNCNDVEVANFCYVELDDIKKNAFGIHRALRECRKVELSNYTILVIIQKNTLDVANTPLL